MTSRSHMSSSLVFLAGAAVARAEELVPLPESAVGSHTRAWICRREACHAWNRHPGSSVERPATREVRRGSYVRSRRKVTPACGVGAPSARRGPPALAGAPLSSAAGKAGCATAPLGTSARRGSHGGPPGGSHRAQPCRGGTEV
jgi:hypothetical protein